MDKPIVTALSSFGMSGLVFHGPFLKVNQGFEVASILERSKELSKELFPGCKIMRNYNEILADPEIELVIVNTPDRYHFEMAAAAINAGKHVVVEKPLTLRSTEARQLIQLAKEKGKLLTVFQNRRWDGDFRTVQQVIQNNKLGRMIEFESHYDRYRTNIAADTWKEEGDDYAGVLYNLGSHMVDQAYVLFGQPEAVTAHLRKVRTGSKVPDYYDLRLEYSSFSAILKCSYLVHTPGPRYTIHGENGTFYKYGIDPQEEMLKAGNLPIGEAWGTEPDSLWGSLFYTENGYTHAEKVETLAGNYHFFYNNLFHAIRNGNQLLVKPEDVAAVLNILEACIVSNREKRTVFL